MFRTIVIALLLIIYVDCLLLQEVVHESDPAILQAQIQAMNATIHNLNQTLLGRISQLETKMSTSTVAFLAEPSQTFVNPVVGRAVIFDAVHLNDGNAYSNIHGIFTAPVSGVYHFTLELSAPPSGKNSNELHVNIMKAATQLGYIYLDANPNRWLKHSATATVHLSKGDDVWVKVAKLVDGGTIAGTAFHSIFSGFLIKAD